MAVRALSKAKKSGIVAVKAPGAPGAVHKTVLERLSGKIDFVPTGDALSLEEGRLWCGGKFTSERIRELVVQGVGEGASTDQTLKAIEKQFGVPVPSFGTVKQWEFNFTAFKAALELAKRSRAEQLQEGSLEMARTAKGKIDLSRAKIYGDQARFMSARMDRAAWGELAMIQTGTGEGALDDKALDRALENMMADKLLSPFLKAMGIAVAGGVQAGVMAGVQASSGGQQALSDIDWSTVDLSSVPLPDLDPVEVLEGS